MSDREQNEVEAIIEVATLAAEPEKLDDHRLAFALPAGGTVKVLDLEEHAPAPERKKGTVTVHTREDLIRYLQRHRLDGSGEDLPPGITTVWVDQGAARITGVLNDHADDPAWRDHQAVLPLQVTDAWKHWRGKDGQLLGQEAFAEHIEEGLPEIADPDGADLFEIVQTFHATSDVTFKQQHRLASGAVKLEWDENVDARAGADGELDVPTEFTLMVSPYEGEAAQQVKARLRFRIKERKLLLSYRLERPDEVERTQLETIALALRGEFEHVYLGRPA